MKRNRKVWLFLLIVLVVIQFIQPTRNHSPGIGENDISKVYAMPSEIHDTFTRKCYDCHSNHTRYPWYFHVQPIGWWLAAHIYEGKEHLNFSEFRTYQADKAVEKLEDIADVIQSRAMPIRGYVLLHPGSAITPQDETAIQAWIKRIRNRE